MWDRVKFIVENLKTIVLAGVVIWALIFASLELTGLIDIDTTCQTRCVEIIKTLNPIGAAKADVGYDFVTGRPSAPITIHVTLLPDVR